MYATLGMRVELIPKCAPIGFVIAIIIVVAVVGTVVVVIIVIVGIMFD